MTSIIDVHRNEIPDFLQKSELYRNMFEHDSIDSADSDESVPMHSKYFYTNLNLTNLTMADDELVQLLHTLHFWNVDSSAVPFEVYDYIHDKHTSFEVLEETFPEYKLIHALKILDRVSHHAIIENCFDELLASNAAKYGHLRLLQYAHLKNYIWNETTCSEAARYGNLDCLKYAHENGCRWSPNTCLHSAMHGHLNCLKYAHENGCPYGDEYLLCKMTASMGELQILAYLHENGCKWDFGTCNEAARNGHLDCLKYAHENGCEWDSTAYIHAMLDKHEHLDIVRYLHENGCEWNEWLHIYAAKKGYLESIRYAHERGCPLTFDAYREAIRMKHHECAQYILREPTVPL